MAKLPAMQFYTGDYLKDPGVRSLSYAARGLWMDMLCLMSESERRGYLSLKGRPISAEGLARMTGGIPAEVVELLAELEESGVFSREEDGTIFSRRMVRDEAFRQSRATNGKKGGRPSESASKPTDNLPETYAEPTVEPVVILDHNLNQTPSSSSSSSKKKKPPVPNGTSPSGEALSPKEALKRFEKFWTAYPRKVGKGAAMKAWGKLVLTEDLDRTILDALSSQIASGLLDLRENMEFCPHPATWLNQRRWEDEVGAIESIGPRASPIAVEERTAAIEAYRRVLEERHPDIQEQFRERVIDPLREEISDVAWDAFIRGLLVVRHDPVTGVLTLYHDQAEWVSDHYRDKIGKLLKAKAVRITSEVEQ